MFHGIHARLYPTRKQENLLKRTFGCCRVVYNHFLAERIRAYKEEGISLNYANTCKMLTTLKQDKDVSGRIDLCHIGIGKMCN